MGVKGVQREGKGGGEEGVKRGYLSSFIDDNVGENGPLGEQC